MPSSEIKFSEKSRFILLGMCSIDYIKAKAPILVIKFLEKSINSNIVYFVLMPSHNIISAESLILVLERLKFIRLVNIESSEKKFIIPLLEIMLLEKFIVMHYY